MRCRLLLAGVLFGVMLATTAAQDGKGGKKGSLTPAPLPGGEGKRAAPLLQGEGKRASGSGTEVDINFLNGSTVRMNVQSEKLEIETPYGKLAVPMSEVRAIEFGSHMPEGHADKIKSAIKGLGSNDFREREKSAATLVALGPYSYAAVVEASRSKQAEMAARAKAVVTKLETKHRKKDLKLSADDRVVTPTFPIVGRILTPSIKVKADYFGEVELKLADMRTLRGIGGPIQSIALAIDSSVYGSRDRSKWLATSLEVDGRTPIVITATGQIDIWPENPGQFIVGPAGNRIRAGFGGKVVGAKSAAGALIGRIGESGPTFNIGDHYEGTPSQAGKLYLQINPSTYTNLCSGSYNVKAGRKE